MKRLGIENPFAYLQSHPDEAALFNQAMTEHSRQSAPAIAEAYDFGAFRKLVDIAGGHGLLLTTILSRYPRLRGLLFDLPEVIEGARKAIAQSDEADRCDTASGDFFQSVPAAGDCYMMKHIIHDWDDERAITILRNCRTASKPGGKLLLIEMVVPPGSDGALPKLLDLEMLLLPGGLERTEEQYARLFDSAGFRLTRIVPTKSPVSVIEAEAV